MKLKRNFATGPLPKFKYDRTDYDWTGRVIRMENQGDLPVAYFLPQLQENPSIFYHLNYKSPSFGAQGFMLRPPCIIIGGDDDLITSLDDQTKKRLDAIGVLHYTAIPVPQLGTYPNTRLQYVLEGQPVYYDDDDVPRLRPKNEWAGGRMYVIKGSQTDYDDYFDYDYSPYGVTEIDWPLCADGENGCDQHANDPGCAGVHETDEVAHSAIDVDITDDPSRLSTPAQDAAILVELINENYDKFKICAWFDEEPEDVTTPGACECITVDESCHSGFSYYEPVQPHTIGSTAPLLAKWRDKFHEVFAGIPGDNKLIRDSKISNSEIVQDILALFEAP